MRKFIKEYFSFTRSELRIIVILSGLILLSLVIRLFFPVPDFQTIKVTAADSMAIDSFIQSLEIITFESSKSIPIQKPADRKFQFNSFDPNSVSLESLAEMGFSEHLRRNLIRYRGAGGKFEKKEDVKKIYGFSDSIYRLWENYIVIQAELDPDTFIPSSFSVNIVELNSADSAQLILINGIGPYFAGKIISYRDRLGGFIKLDQLLEIRGMDQEKLDKIRDQITIDTVYIVKVNLNTATINDLKKHPYISPRLAESLMKYRTFAGSVKTTDELFENRIITISELNRLKPYFFTGE